MQARLDTEGHLGSLLLQQITGYIHMQECFFFYICGWIGQCGNPSFLSRPVRESDTKYAIIVTYKERFSSNATQRRHF